MEENFAWAAGLGEEWLRKQHQVDILRERIHTSLQPSAFRQFPASFRPQSRTIELLSILKAPVVHLLTDKQCATIPTSCDNHHHQLR